MIKAFLKFALPVTISGVGGASALGITSNNQNQPVLSSSTIDNSSSQEQVRDTLSSTPLVVTVTETHNLESSSPLELQPQQEIARETSTLHSDSEHTVAELEPQRAEQVGNCQVINVEESVISKLPTDYKYVSFSCQNNGGEETVLTNWKGFFPETLFKGGSQAFPLERKFSIEVNEGENEDEEDPEGAIYKTTFKSEEFLPSSSFVGKWSSEVVDETGDLDVYKVRLDDKPNSVDYVYLTYN